MADMRSCIKTGCRWPAAATLSYRYATAEVWLSDLADDHPSTHDLCPHHADSMTVPRGWTLVDDRRHVEAVHEPSAAEIVERVATLRGTVDRMLAHPGPSRPDERASRYSGLLADLPTYDPPTEAPDAERADPDADRSRHALVGVGLSHEIAPVPSDMAPVRSVIGRRDAVQDPREASTHDPDSPLDGDDEIDLSDQAVDERADEEAQTAHPGGDGDPAGASGPQLRGAVVLTLPFVTNDDLEG